MNSNLYRFHRTTPYHLRDIPFESDTPKASFGPAMWLLLVAVLIVGGIGCV